MKRAYGFTLIELMITIVVAIVLMSIAVPSFRIMLANNRATTQANALFVALNYARSEAIGRRATVTVCPKDSPTTTNNNCGSSGDWANGWFVFFDAAAGTIGDFDSSDGDLELKHWAPLPGEATVNTTQAYIGFDGNGEKNTVTANQVSILLSEAGTSGTAERCILVAPIGMVRVYRSTTCP